MDSTGFGGGAPALPGRAPAWGWLTGIRPAKLMTALLNGGLDGEEAQEEMRRLYGVSPERAELCLAVAKAGLRVKLGPEDTAIYIGVPFCPTRCAYCSFVSAAAGRSGKYMEPFVSALEYELEQTAQTIKTLGLRVKAVYIGGGTPTALPLELFKRMLGAVGRHIPFGDVEEYTIEAGRADTITPENTAVMREYGADRISVNPQSMNEKTLELIGRRHGVGEVYRAFELTKGFGAVNMDVIAGLPGENAGDFEQTLSSVIALQPENITVHTLSRKRGSDMSGDSAPPEEHVSEMIEHSLKALPRAGYGPYYLYRQKFMAGDFENIGWSADGHDCLYNIIMMEEKVSVLALGGGGVTRLVHPDTRFIDRAYNQKYASEYNNSQAKIDKKQQFVISFYQSDGTQRKRGFYWP